MNDVAYSKSFHMVWLAIKIISVRLSQIRWVLLALAISIVVGQSGFFVAASHLLFYLDLGCQPDSNCSVWRVDTRWTSPVSGESGVWATSPAPIAQMIRTGFGNSFTVSSFTPIMSSIFVDGTNFPKQAAYLNESATLGAFDWNVIEGKRPKDLLPGQALITTREARRLFGDESALGRTFTVTTGKRYRKELIFTVETIIGVFRANTVFRPDLIGVIGAAQPTESVPLPGFLRELPLEWLKPHVYTFLRGSLSMTEETLDDLKQSLSAHAPNLNGWRPQFLVRSAQKAWITSGIYENLMMGVTTSSLYLVAAVILVLLCSSAVATLILVAIIGVTLRPTFVLLNRIGIPTLIFRLVLLVGVVIASLVLTGMAYAAAWLWIPQFAQIVGAIPNELYREQGVAFILVAMVALVFSFLGAFAVLGALTITPALIRRSISTMAFLIGSFAIALSVLMVLQQYYVFTRDLGFNGKDVFTFSIDDDDVLAPRLESLKQEIATIPGVLGVSAAQSVPGDFEGFQYLELRQFRQGSASNYRVQTISADWEYCKILGIELVSGELPRRPLRSDITRESMMSDVLINEAAAERLGFNTPDEAIYQRLAMFDSDDSSQALRVIGVVKDFHLFPPLEPIKPLLIYQQQSQLRKIIIKLSPEAPSTILKEIDAIWKSLLPTIRYDRSYLPSSYKAYTRRLDAIGNSVVLGCLLSTAAIFIAVFGVTRFLTISRHREIAIRRIVGARVLQLAPFYIHHFLWPLTIGICVAFPTSIAVGSIWLGNFAYRISGFDIDVMLLVLGSMISLSIGSIAISFLLEAPSLLRREILFLK